jgi:hypothetical protein
MISYTELDEEWGQVKAKRVFEARQNAAKNTTAHGHRTVTARSPRP